MAEQILNDRYAIEQKVGEGGMAVTYRARDILLNRVVAVKIMREQFTTDPQFVERFRREAQAAACLSHEHIANVYDTGRAQGTYYIVMEFVEGTDLKQRLRREGPLPLLTTLEIGRQIASALEAAHRNGLVHRDIKPHNILLNKDGNVKVTDFGIAKIASDGDDTGVIIGSVHYLSPEQARGDATTPSSDIYSFGAVLFEMLTGRTVFEGENAMAVAHKQVYEQPPMPRTLRPDVPPAVEAVVLRCLEKDARARYQSAAEVQAVLTQLVNQLTQEETVVVPGTLAPSMDATMIYRKPVAPEAHPGRPMPTLPPDDTPDPPRGRATGWIIGLLFLILAFGVAFGVAHLLRPVRTDGGTTPLQQAHLVPDVTGQTLDNALHLLETKGYTGHASHMANAQEKGLVFQQDPLGDTQLEPGGTVEVYVSDGPATFSMPDVTNMTYDAATQEITAAGYHGKFSTDFQPSDMTANGLVVITTPAAGAVVDSTTKMVKLVISSGKTPTKDESYTPGTVPDVGGATTYVRIELENPIGSEASVIFEQTLNKGDTIPVQHFTRRANEHAKITLYAGAYESSLKMIGEEFFPARSATRTSSTHSGAGTPSTSDTAESAANPATPSTPSHTTTTPAPSTGAGTPDGSATQ